MKTNLMGIDARGEATTVRITASKRSTMAVIADLTLNQGMALVARKPRITRG